MNENMATTDTNITSRTASSHLPRAFFQPILTSFLSDFRIPEDFRKYMLDAGGKSNTRDGMWVELKNSWDLKTWHVRIDTDCNWCLKDGWEVFAQDHHLRVGQLVVFDLVSSSTIRVSVFDAITSCQIYYPEENPLTDAQQKFNVKVEYTEEGEETRKDEEMKQPNSCLTTKHKVLGYTKQGEEESRQDKCLTANHKVPEYTEQGEEESRQSKETKRPNSGLTVKYKVSEYTEQGEKESRQNREMKRPNSCLTVKRKVSEYTEQGEKESRQNKEMKRSNSCLTVKRKVPEYTEQGGEEFRQNKEMKRPNSRLTVKHKVPEYTEQGGEESRENKEMKRPNACGMMKHKVPEPDFWFSGNPYFCATIKKYCFRWPGLLIPIEFAKFHNLYRRWCDVILVDEVQRKWMIHLRYRKSGKDQTYLSAGWDEFQAANGLKYGDKIALELISAGECPEMRFHKLCEVNQKCPT